MIDELCNCTILVMVALLKIYEAGDITFEKLYEYMETKAEFLKDRLMYVKSEDLRKRIVSVLLSYSKVIDMQKAR